MKNALVSFIQAFCVLAGVALICICTGETSSDSRKSDGSTRYNQSILGFERIRTPRSTRATDTRAIDTPYRQSLRWLSGKRDSHTPEKSNDTPPTQAIWERVTFVPPAIKKDGNTNKNYVVMISADWCGPCKSMYPIMDSLKKEGYIIYVFHVNRKGFQSYDESYGVFAYPTFIVYDKGKEIHRRVGRTTKDWFKAKLKTAKEQLIKPDDNPYKEL